MRAKVGNLKGFVLLLVIASLPIASLTAGASPTPDDPLNHVGGQVENIVILHINDIHGNLLPYESGIGGSSYIASIVDNERAQNPGRVLLLDAGDIIDGAPIGDLFYGQSVIEVMNAMGFDAMTVGNHELGRYGGDYDYGVIPIENDYLLDLKEAAEFPMLAANVLINGSNPFESYVIENIGGIRIGIIGVTVYFPPPENVEILDSSSAVQQCVDEIENQVDLIIALTHLGSGNDMALAFNVEGIDIIIGGHSHTVMWEPENVGGTRIVQAGSYGMYVGRIYLEYDVENHEIDNFSYELLEVDHLYLQENQGIKEMVENFNNIISPIVDVKIGYTENDLYGSELGWLVAESFRESTGADVGYQNTGGIRNYIPAGDIIIRQVHKVLPYGNKLMSMDLRGDYLKGQLGYGYVAGAYYESPEWYLENGELIEDDEYYRVATNEYTGTRYDFVYGENILYHGICRDAFIDYLKEAFSVLDISILPRENKGSLGEELIFIVTVKNTGGTTDNYLLESVDNRGWPLEFGNEVLEVPAGENRTTTLTVTISENAEPGTEDNITVTATSINDNLSDSDWCVVHVEPWTGTAAVRTLGYDDGMVGSLYWVRVYKDLQLFAGSKLVVKFYRYNDTLQAENVIDEFTSPENVKENENVSHPRRAEGCTWGTVQKATLVLTTDNTDEVLSTIASFTMHQSDLMNRYIEILVDWFGHPELQDAFRNEIICILTHWFSAPP